MLVSRRRGLDGGAGGSRIGVRRRSSSPSPGGGSPPLPTARSSGGVPACSLGACTASASTAAGPGPPTNGGCHVLDASSSGAAGRSRCCRSFRSRAARPSTWASSRPTTRAGGRSSTDIELPGADGLLRVVGTHLAHLSQGSPRHIASLRRTLNAMTPVPSVLAGDMNLWGPPLVLLLPGWSRAVRGRTWPTWSRWPLAQPDHILVRGPARAESGEVLPITDSDHLPVRATLVID